MTTRRFILSRNDWLALIALVALWLLFFWRLFTPIAGDQASLKQGDFSGQFVAFGAYQYQRMSVGEVPLWNPYNNGGMPFLADTQSAVFYPPRLLTIALARLSGGWSYHALELEMTFHVLFYSLTMYALVRRLTLARAGSITGALAAAVIASYGGYLSGYPPLQLAVLEAGVWLPLALLGVTEAARREQFRWCWLLLTGLALGLSWLAGHPQTSWFLTYLLVAYLGYQVYGRRDRWQVFVLGVMLFGALAFGLAAVQLLPGLEYLPQTARVDFTYGAKGNGFPFRDVIQLLFPGVMSLFSPLYVGIPALALAFIALWSRTKDSLFWGLVALVALGLSFGANSVVFPALYNLLPGLRFFRGQERAVYLVVNSLAILAGWGLVVLAEWDKARWAQRTKHVRWMLAVLFGVTAVAGALVFHQWLEQRDALNDTLNTVLFSTIISAALLLVVWQMLNQPQAGRYRLLLVALLTFELFTVNMDAASNYDPVPPASQLSMTPPPLVARVLEDDAVPFRVDGFRGLHDNYGSLYRVLDMRGISPLFLDGVFNLVEPEKINPLAWELMAVRYVYSDWEQLPAESAIIASGEDRYGTVNLHRLDDPRPFAHLLTQAEVVDSDEFARALLADPNFNPRDTVIIDTAPTLELSAGEPDEASASVTAFAPEIISIEVDTPENVILSIAHPHYPGWQASLDGEPAPMLRAYGALTALEVPAGQHEIRLVYDPLSYRVGAVLSLFTWAALVILAVVWLIAKPRGVPHAAK